jgi:hypothetical protein
VQATVALETLFGEKSTSELTGIGALLANRCAYLVSKSRRERDEVVRSVKKIYDTRSKIVHEGRDQLNREDRARLIELKALCARSLENEVLLLARDKGFES